MSWELNYERKKKQSIWKSGKWFPGRYKDDEIDVSLASCEDQRKILWLKCRTKKKIVVDEIWEPACSWDSYLLPSHCKTPGYNSCLWFLKALITLSSAQKLPSFRKKNPNSLIWHSRPSTTYVYNCLLFPFTQSMLQ